MIFSVYLFLYIFPAVLLPGTLDYGSLATDSTELYNEPDSLNMVLHNQEDVSVPEEPPSADTKEKSNKNISIYIGSNGQIYIIPYPDTVTPGEQPGK